MAVVDGNKLTLTPEDVGSVSVVTCEIIDQDGNVVDVVEETVANVEEVTPYIGEGATKTNFNLGKTDGAHVEIDSDSVDLMKGDKVVASFEMDVNETGEDIARITADYGLRITTPSASEGVRFTGGAVSVNPLEGNIYMKAESNQSGYPDIDMRGTVAKDLSPIASIGEYVVARLLVQDNWSISANSAKGQSTLLTDYKVGEDRVYPVGVLGFNIENATKNGANCTKCQMYSCCVNKETDGYYLRFSVSNRHTAAAVVKVYVDVLFAKYEYERIEADIKDR